MLKPTGSSRGLVSFHEALTAKPPPVMLGIAPILFGFRGHRIMFGRYLVRGLGILLALAALATLQAGDDTKKPASKDTKKPAVKDKETIREREEAKPAPKKKGKDDSSSSKPGSPLANIVFKSGPQTGELIPGSFAPFNVNGKRKDRYHCLVCDYGVEPVVLVFAREPAEGKDEALSDLLKKLDDAVERHQDKFLHSFVVFLSPDAPGAPAGAEETPEKLVKEATARVDLNARLLTRAEKLKTLVVGSFPAEGPKGYKISNQAEVTVLFYSGFKVEKNFAFKAGELQPDNVSIIIKAVNDRLSRPKRTSVKSAAK
jgi:hypothetical protein